MSIIYTYCPNLKTLLKEKNQLTGSCNSNYINSDSINGEFLFHFDFIGS